MAGFSGSTLGAVKRWVLKEIGKAVVGASNYKGAWNASTNTPTINTSSGTDGDFYTVSVAGTFDGKTFEVYDTIKYSDEKGWEKFDTHVQIQAVIDSERRAEQYANLSQDKANQSSNSATQAGTYATQAGNCAAEAMGYRDDVIGKFWQGDMAKYNEDVKKGIIKADTIAFIMQESA